MPKVTLDDLSGRIDDLAKTTNERFDAVDQRFDAVDQRFDVVDQRFSGVEQRLNEHSEGLERLHGAVTEMNTAVQFQTRETVAAIERFTETVVEKLREHEERIRALGG